MQLEDIVVLGVLEEPRSRMRYLLSLHFQLTAFGYAVGVALDLVEVMLSVSYSKGFGQ